MQVQMPQCIPREGGLLDPETVVEPADRTSIRASSIPAGSGVPEACVDIKQLVADLLSDSDEEAGTACAR